MPCQKQSAAKKLWFGGKVRGRMIASSSIWYRSNRSDMHGNTDFSKKLCLAERGRGTSSRAGAASIHQPQFLPACILSLNLPSFPSSQSSLDFIPALSTERAAGLIEAKTKFRVERERDGELHLQPVATIHHHKSSIHTFCHTI